MFDNISPTTFRVNDCRDGYEYNWCSEESALNVNGDMEVYLPTDNNPDSVRI